MCGIAGYMMLDGSAVQSNEVVLQMLKVQKHRGPDDTGIIGINPYDNQYSSIRTNSIDKFPNNPSIIFGFNRLSILDLSINGHQPMVSPDNRTILMMNGEIYNAFDYRADLISKGYKFKSKTDTEIVLALYQVYGIEEMLRKLNGMFAIVIYDFKLKRLFIARDRVGIKPMYILKENNRISFSSEIKSFKYLPGYNFTLNSTGLCEFLIFRNLINETLFKNIINCTPGTYLEISLDGVINNHQYYDINEEGNSKEIIKNYHEYLENSLNNSVRRQMISDVKLGSQLSGGIDSSLVTWFASQTLQSGNLETISIIFKDPKYSEEKYINTVTSKLNLLAHKYTLDAEFYFDTIDNATWHFEQPLNHPNTIGIYLLSQQAKKHVTVLLSGEGADETLAGYTWFLDLLQNPYLSLNFLRKIKQNRKNIFSFLNYYKDDKKRLILASSFGSIALAKEVYPDFDLNLSIRKRLEILKKVQGKDDLNKHRKYEILTYLPDLLMRQDKMSMAHSIENRVPFLDNEMLKTSLSLPKEVLIARKNNRLIGKAILKEICASKFDKSFAYRPKMGFGIPLKEFMSSEAFNKRWIDEILPGIEKRAIFNSQPLNKWMSNLDSLNYKEVEILWIMTSFELWAKKYLD
jgi:asparagine synthase (glutamine-hydrolysing)